MADRNFSRYVGRRNRPAKSQRRPWLVDPLERLWRRHPAGDLLSQKIGTAWTGTWTARAAEGTPLSGTWSADLPAFTGKTIEDMLQQATAKEAAGAWQTGCRQGHWWLKSLSAPPHR